MRYIKFICILITMLMLTSCYNYKEIGGSSIVGGVALDYDYKKDEYITTIEVINMDQDNNIEPEIYSARGESIFDSIRNLIVPTSKKLFWSHLKVFIVSKDVIKYKKLIQALDMFDRDAEARLDGFIILSDEDTAGEILEVSKTMDKSVSIFLEELMNNYKSLSKYEKKYLYEFIDEYVDNGMCATMPLIYINEEDSPYIDSTALFKAENYVGVLDGEMTKYYLLIKDNFKGGLLSIDTDDYAIAFEIISAKSSMKPSIINNNIYMDINIKLVANISEVNGDINYKEKDNYLMIKSQLEDNIKDNIENCISYIKLNYNCDTLGFGKALKIYYPDYYKNIKNMGIDIVDNIECNISVEATLRGSSLSNKSITLVDR